jgi:excisionase family DNA binding protein
LGNKIIHFRPFGWAATACRLSPLTFPALVTTIDPHQVDCKHCLVLMHDAMGKGALHADAIRELTAITLDIATKRDIADLKQDLAGLKQDITDLKAGPDRTGRALTTARGGSSNSPHMLIGECAVYIGRTVTAVRGLIARRAIPHSHVGGRLQFNREAIDRWMRKNARQLS